MGVFDREGTFHAAPPDLDFSPLEELFRQRTLKMMLQSEKISEERVELLRCWKHSAVCFRWACKISSKWAAGGRYLGHGVSVDGAFR